MSETRRRKPTSPRLMKLRRGDGPKGEAECSVCRRLFRVADMVHGHCCARCNAAVAAVMFGRVRPIRGRTAPGEGGD